MLRILLFALLAAPAIVQAQLPWVRQVELKCAYHNDTIDEDDHHIHSFLLFYGNDSVVFVEMATYEGYYEVDPELPADTLITRFIEEFHCEPEDYSEDSGVYTYLFTGTSLTRGTKAIPLHFQRDGAILSWGGTRYRSLACWNEIVHPKHIPWWSGCLGDP